MDLGSAITFVFEDEEWVKKLLIGAAITLVPFFGMFVLMGYGIAIIRNVRSGAVRVLPDWSDIGQYFMDGLMVSIAMLVYALPFLIVSCPAMLVSFGPMVAGDNERLMEILAGVSGIVALAMGCVMILYSIVLMLVGPVVQIKYADTNSLGACLRFGEVFGFAFGHVGELLIAMLAVLAAGAVVGVIDGVIGTIVAVLSMIPICGWILGLVVGLLAIPLVVWMIAFTSHLYGQIGRPTTPGYNYNYPV